MTTQIRYVPGTWVCLVGPTICLLADWGPDSGVFARCWTLVRDGATVEDVLDTVVRDGLRAVGDFALASFGTPQGQLVVRGKATIDLIDEAGDTQTIHAVDVSTWLERPWNAMAGSAMLSAPAAAEGLDLPLLKGVALAARVVVGVERKTVAPPAAETSSAEPVGTVSAAEETYDHLFSPPQREPEREPEPAPTVDLGPKPVPELESVEATRVRPVAAAKPRMEDGIITSVPWDLPAEPSRMASTVKRDQLPAVTGRPNVGVLRLSTGDTITLDRDVVLGRGPTTTEETAAAKPNLVRLPDAGDDLSRNHVHVHIEDGVVFVTDLGSTNGTTVTAPSGPCTRLPPGRPTEIANGAVVSLADVVTFRFEAG